MSVIRQAFSIKEIKYPLLLIASMLFFLISLVLHRWYPSYIDQSQVLLYGTAIAVAVLWCILNYVAHLKSRSIFAAQSDISAFINGISVPGSEKEELTLYLLDFAQDLEEQGKTSEEAARIAIMNFQVKEFISNEGTAINLKAHFYLLGTAILLCALAFAALLLNLLIPGFVLAALSFTLFLYGCSLGVLFVFYQLTNIALTKK